MPTGVDSRQGRLYRREPQTTTPPFVGQAAAPILPRRRLNPGFYFPVPADKISAARSILGAEGADLEVQPIEVQPGGVRR